MQYLTYEEYQEIGGMLDLTAFNRNIDRACGMIDNHTRGRIHGFFAVPEKVKYCCRDLVTYIAQNAVEKSVTSRSQSAGAVSESVSFAVKTVDEYYDDIVAIMADYLGLLETESGVPVLYRGAAQ